ncbi:MAG: KpsF/GutQ family sugar-phosphate isomerase [Bacteroidetes bacterium]|nr:KpsF/GutQ family sugar-phosphate isomerase [Bacteroidota bacterium]
MLTPENRNRILSYAHEAFSIELASLAAMPERLDDAFATAVDWMLGTSGRVVFTGIGKSAIIAQKIVATMNSTGTPALFMHAADAIHGDLGMIQPADVLVAISKSGNTPEIKVLVPLLKRQGNRLIAMVGNLNSELAHAADLILDTTVEREACPHNLAPTSSTTAQLLMGDALAVALLRMKEFSSEDFSKYHPGGALGKQLYLRAGQLARQHEAPRVAEDAPLKEVIAEISGRRLGATAVLDASGALAGIITDGDIRRMLEQRSDIAGIQASDIMNPNPRTVDGHVLAVQLVSLMQDLKISQIVVTDAGKYAGMVHIHDLNREGLL